MKNTNYKTFYKQILLLVFSLLPCLLFSQNFVVSVTGKVSVNGQPVKKGDYLSDNQKVVFDDSNAELKLIAPGPPGHMYVITYKDYEKKKRSELLELIKSCFQKNSTETCGTRGVGIHKTNPDKDKQIESVDALCKTLNVTQDNVNEMFTQYITPYCEFEFETPYWEDITQFMQSKYGFEPSH